MGAVASLCQTGFWMQQGRLVKRGPARAIVDEYLTANADRMQTVMDLTQSRRASGEHGRKLRIEKAEWLSGMPMQHGEPFSIRIHFRTMDVVEAASVGVGFKNLEGTRLVTYDTDFQDGYRPTLQPDKTYVVDVTAELPLAPGIYMFAIGCRSGDAFGMDYIPDAGQVEVVMGPKTPGYIAVPGAGVRLTSEWRWQGGPPAPPAH
jgi:hypothetical protein